MNEIKITITVTEDGKNDNVSNIFPMNVPISRLSQILETSKGSLTKAFIDYCEASGISTKGEFEKVAKTLTLKDIIN